MRPRHTEGGIPVSVVVEAKMFPPPEEMPPNTVVTVDLPKHIFNDITLASMEAIKHAIFSIAEQEINIHTIFYSRVTVIIREVST